MMALERSYCTFGQGDHQRNNSSDSDCCQHYGWQRQWILDAKDCKYLERYLKELEDDKERIMLGLTNDADFSISKTNTAFLLPHVRTPSVSSSAEKTQVVKCRPEVGNIRHERPSHGVKKSGELSKEERFLNRYLEELEEQRESFVRNLSFQGDDSLNDESIDGPYHDFLTRLEVFICNMPLTIGAVGLGWVTQGVVWFKFMEENTHLCVPVRFNSPECTYPEFPGCFKCDTSAPLYLSIVTFHYFCHLVGFVCCLLFVLRAIFATRAVVDELSNPATSTPMGVVCITMVCVFAGRGKIGEAMVVVTSLFHFLLAVWFLYTAIFKFRLLPDPGWFPNSTSALPFCFSRLNTLLSHLHSCWH